MNEYVKRMIMEKQMDSRDRADYEYDGSDYARGGARDYNNGNIGRRDYAGVSGSNMGGGSRDGYNFNQRDEEYNYDVRFQEPYENVRYGRAGDYNRPPYGMYDHNMPFRIAGQFDYARPGDYHGKGAMRLTKKDIQKWKNNMKNADGTTGEHFNLEQLLPIAEKLGIKFKDFDEKEFCLTANMLYSDYCEVLKPLVTPDKEELLYVKLAKAFLEDEDAPEGYEKLYLYYTCIVDNDE